MHDRVGFNPGARQAELLGLDEGRPGAAEGVEDALTCAQGEFLDIIPNQVRGKGQDKPIPLMNRKVLFVEAVQLLSGFALLGV